MLLYNNTEKEGKTVGTQNSVSLYKAIFFIGNACMRTYVGYRHACTLQWYSVLV